MKEETSKTFNERFDEKYIQDHDGRFYHSEDPGNLVFADEIKSFFLSEIKKLDEAVEGMEKVPTGRFDQMSAKYNAALSDIRALLKEYLTHLTK